jgi:hypothetical protein
MSRTAVSAATGNELARRAAAGLEISLLWHERDDRLEVVVYDANTGVAFTLSAGNGKEALDAFYHPFAYAAARGVDYPVGNGRDLHVTSAASPLSPP